MLMATRRGQLLLCQWSVLLRTVASIPPPLSAACRQPYGWCGSTMIKGLKEGQEGINDLCSDTTAGATRAAPHRRQAAASAASMMSPQYLPLPRVLALLIQLLNLQSILLPTFCSLPCLYHPQIHAVTTWISYSIIQTTSKASLLFTPANTPSFRKPSPHSQH
jgi:hypothetical protein